MVSIITDRVITEFKEWQSRSLEKNYPSIFIVKQHIISSNNQLKNANYFTTYMSVSGKIKWVLPQIW